jgi:hypothetical protein
MYVYMYIQKVQIILGQTIFNALLCLVSVGLVSAFMLGSIRSVFLLSLTVTMIDFDLFGCIPLLNEYLNLITMICLILAIGLMVDYLAHIMHYSTHAMPAATSGPKAQVTAAVCQIGPSVLLGASTTLVGVLPLGFASSYIFRIFFKMFIATIFLALLHAFFFLPALLLIFPVQIQAKVHPTDAKLDSPTESAVKAGASVTLWSLSKKQRHAERPLLSKWMRRSLKTSTTISTTHESETEMTTNAILPSSDASSTSSSSSSFDDYDYDDYDDDYPPPPPPPVASPFHFLARSLPSSFTPFARLASDGESPFSPQATLGRESTLSSGSIELHQSSSSKNNKVIETEM